MFPLALAVVVLGTSLTPVHVEPRTLHVRWAIRYRDLAATADADELEENEYIVNVPGLFPRTERRTRPGMHPHLRVVIAGRTAFDRYLTPAEVRRLGSLEVLHVAHEVRGAGEHDLATGGTAMLQYRGLRLGYRLVRATPPTDSGAAWLSNCARQGSFESERTASFGGVVVSVLQGGPEWDCLFRRARVSEVTIASGGTTVYRTRATIARGGKETPEGTVGGLHVLDGPAFVDFEGTGRLAIVLSGTTGGMHCCIRTHVFYQTASRGYAETAHWWGNGLSYPVLVRDPRSGEVLFGSSNDAFAWMFIGYTHAFEPAQIFAFERGRFLDVTPDFPGVVDEQAGRLWHIAVQLRRHGEIAAFQSAITSYLADMAILGRGTEGWRNVRRLCGAPECAAQLSAVAAALREVHYR